MSDPTEEEIRAELRAVARELAAKGPVMMANLKRAFTDALVKIEEKYRPRPTVHVDPTDKNRLIITIPSGVFGYPGKGGEA